MLSKVPHSVNAKYDTFCRIYENFLVAGYFWPRKLPEKVFCRIHYHLPAITRAGFVTVVPYDGERDA